MERLHSDGVVCRAPQPGPFADRDDHHAVRHPRRRLVADLPDLLDLPVHLAEAIPLGEADRPRIINVAAHLAEAHSGRPLGQHTQDRRADALTPPVRQHPRRDRARAGQVGLADDPRASQHAVHLG
jgi:hypothetical protein